MDNFRNLELWRSIANANTEIRRLKSQLTAAADRERVLEKENKELFEIRENHWKRIAKLEERERVLVAEVEVLKEKLSKEWNEMAEETMISLEGGTHTTRIRKTEGG